MTIDKKYFGKASDGKDAHLFTLANKNGIRAMITNFGGRIAQLWLPDRSGRFDDVVMGFDSLYPYQNPHPYFGALIGRFANRIANGVFSLNGKTYNLDTNNPPNHLHGGIQGFDSRVWAAEPVEEEDGGKLRLTLESPNGDQGYPGNLQVQVVYSLTGDNRLSIAYNAQTDADTIVNLTNHSYFNLKGHNSGTVLNHRLRINANTYLPTDATGIPLGGAEDVAGTPFDMREMPSLGSRINDHHIQMSQKSGFDIHFISWNQGRDLKKLCEVIEPDSRRTMEVWTTKPGVHLYTSNYIKDNAVVTGKGGYVYQQYCGFCLETQYPPNSPNNPALPSVVLRRGEEYRHETVFVFGA